MLASDGHRSTSRAATPGPSGGNNDRENEDPHLFDDTEAKDDGEDNVKQAVLFLGSYFLWSTSNGCRLTQANEPIGRHLCASKCTK
jgi:hypothetical protein